MILLTMTGHPGLNVKPVREVFYLHCGGISSMHMHMYSQAQCAILYSTYMSSYMYCIHRSLVETSQHLFVIFKDIVSCNIVWTLWTEMPSI